IIRKWRFLSRAASPQSASTHLPLPLGEGWGEGILRSSDRAFPLSLYAASRILTSMSDGPVSDVLTKPAAAFELTLRPSLFSDFTGQAKVKERLEISVQAAKQRNEPLDHILLSGPPGLGKITLANIIAKAMGANLKSTSGPTIEKAGDLAGLLTNLEEG